MPDVTLRIEGLSDKGDSERLELALLRLGFVELACVDAEREVVAISYEGGGEKLREIEGAVRNAGFDFEATPGSRRLEG